MSEHFIGPFLIVVIVYVVRRVLDRLHAAKA